MPTPMWLTPEGRALHSAFDAGYDEACDVHGDLRNNPYPPMSHESHEWVRGYETRRMEMAD